MPHDATTLRQDIILKDRPGGNDRVILTKHESPANDDGGVAHDPFLRQDMALAKTMMQWLEREYPGHLWATQADIRQGVAMFNIPILMGTTEWWVVNLRTHDIIDGMRQGAGQILERYRMDRGAFNLTQFLDAREKHSKLVLPSRKVPE